MFLRIASIFMLALAGWLSPSLKAATKPNVVFILCDDLGYGDVKCFNPEGKILTPQMDAIAARGMKFTDAHTSSSVCTPTRYGVMTGRYNWRSKLQRGVLGGLSPRLIEPGRTTVASFLKSQGYATACVGKWHLGMDWVKLPGKQVTELNIESPEQVNSVDYTQPIINGPNSVGFDYYYGISASLDMVPYCFIENDRVTEVPTATLKMPMNKGKGPATTREGPAAPGFDGVQVLPELTKKSVKFIQDQARGGKPFFLYVPLASPHTPVLPSPEWQGRSGLNLYADFVMQTDDAIGQIARALQEAGLQENTLLVVTSDNGCSPQADYPTLLAKGHNPSGPLRGTKADIYEGGHRVPFIVQWPAVAKAGSVYEHPICLVDFMATCADALGIALPENAAEDSVSLLPALKGGNQPVREAVVHHSITGAFSIRQGSWKLELCPGSGGWSDPRPGTEPAGAPRLQLFDLAADPAETHNVQAGQPEVVARLTKLLEKYVADGRSTPGAPQPNTVSPDIQQGLKPTPPAKKKNPPKNAGA
ncbi:MAG: arylsulfatase [Verrucomicrobium sp.]|nr:arylsulfatase [Verrucomicrobium sp.]